MGRSLLFVGGATRRVSYAPAANAPGISAFAIDTESGAATPVGVTAGIDNPTFLAISPDGRQLAATIELEGWNEGLVALFGLDARTGRLTYVNQQPSRGDVAAHCSFDNTSRWLAVVNYGALPPDARPDRSLALYPVTAAGELGPVASEVTHRGATGPHTARQERSHPHCARWTPDNRFLIVTDLGFDRLFCYVGDPPGQLALVGETALASGSGPRHFDFHPTKSLLYLVNELSADVATLRLGAAGKLEVLAVSGVPDGVEGCSAIRVAPDGRRLFIGDRGHHAVLRFRIDPGTGIAAFEEGIPSGGRTPRDLAFSPDGTLLAVANQDSDGIAVFRYDAATGGLAPLGPPIPCGTPTVVAFAPEAPAAS